VNGLHLFIDNSNIFIEAQRVAREKYFYDDELVIRVRISYGELLEKVRKERKLMETVLVGSRPPLNDLLWEKLKTLGITPRIFDRNIYSGKEKGVDAELSNSIRDTLEDNNKPGTIAIIAGDRDYVPTLARCLKKGWKVELYFWSQASSELKNLTGIEFHSLDDFFPEITFKAKQKE
jgi:uncharacterized LabA/DUF88 family protein